MVLGRLIHFFHPEHRVWRIKGISVAKYFVWADVSRPSSKLLAG
jgi:hypothetical protein